MIERYRCRDGREVYLVFAEEALSVTVATRNGEEVGRYQFAHVLPSGELVDLLEDRGEPAGVKLREGHLAESWYGQGIEERILRLVAEETDPSHGGQGCVGACPSISGRG